MSSFIVGLLLLFPNAFAKNEQVPLKEKVVININGKKLEITEDVSIQSSGKKIFSSSSPRPFNSKVNNVYIGKGDYFAIIDISFGDGEDVAVSHYFVIPKEIPKQLGVALSIDSNAKDVDFFSKGNDLYYAESDCLYIKEGEDLKLFKYDWAQSKFVKEPAQKIEPGCLPPPYDKLRSFGKMKWTNIPAIKY